MCFHARASEMCRTSPLAEGRVLIKVDLLREDLLSINYASRPIGPPTASRARAESDTVEGSDDGAQVNGVAGGARNGAQCAHIVRGCRL